MAGNSKLLIGRWLTFALGLGAPIIFMLLLVFSQGAAPATANPLGGILSISSGETHSCAVTQSGDVKCWGYNGAGQVGDGTTESRLVPVAVSGLDEQITAVSAGEFHTCALTILGAAKCWGYNFFGQLGNGANATALSPVDVIGMGAGATSISTGYRRTCAVVSGAVLCWGEGYGSVPVAVSGLSSGVAQVLVGAKHTCALTVSGGVKCWGDNIFGQLGDGTRTASTTPVQVVGLESGVRSLPTESPGLMYHTCVIKTDDTVHCWGLGEHGQLGSIPLETSCGAVCSLVPIHVDKLDVDVRNLTLDVGNSCAVSTDGMVFCWGTEHGSPAAVSGLPAAVTQMSRGGGHSCVLTDAQTVSCWGANDRGQLGDGTDVGRSAPADVVEFSVKPTPTATPCPASGCPVTTPTPPCQSEACMALAVRDGTGEIVCHSGFDTDCDIATGSRFSLLVDAHKVPELGYLLVQTAIDYGTDGDLTYHEASSAGSEFIWPDARLTLRNVRTTGLLFHGAVTGLIDPFLSSYVGYIVELEFTCSPDASSTLVGMLAAGDARAGTAGAMFVWREDTEETEATQVVPQLTPLTVNCIEPAPAPADSDGDGCEDVREAVEDETLGGERNFLNPWDFYDVDDDQIIDLPNDVLGVIQHFSPQGQAPYDVHFDRGPSAGPSPWNMTAPDGVIDLPNDILGVIQQFGHDCR